MQPTKILTDEHRVIEVALECLETMVEAAMRDKKLDKQDAEELLEFVHNYADTCHHGKEEKQLFPKLTEKGLSRDSGPIAVMHEEHDLGRELTRIMRENLLAASEGDQASLDNFAKSAWKYVTLLKEHIEKEDTVLFPMAEEMLSDQEKKTLVEDFAKVEATLLPGVNPENFIKNLKRIATKYNVPADPIATATCACACGHNK